jgi:hypothetical protein
MKNDKKIKFNRSLWYLHLWIVNKNYRLINKTIGLSIKTIGLSIFLCYKIIIAKFHSLKGQNKTK